MGSRFRIMVVDDDVDLRDLLRMSFSADYELFDARNGLDATLKLAKYQPDLAIVDMMMPIMNGQDLIRKIRQTPGFEDMPIIALSALNQRADIKTGYDAGADLYLTKPFVPERVSRNIAHLLDSRKPRPKELTIEEIGEKERIAEAHRLRALSKKKEDGRTTEVHEDSPDETASPQETPRPRRASRAAVGKIPGSLITIPEHPVLKSADAIVEHPRRSESPKPHADSPHPKSPRPAPLLAERDNPALQNKPRPATHSDDMHDPFVDRDDREHPLAPHHVPPPAPGRDESPASGEHRLPVTGVPRIMIVDDDEDFLVLMRATLEEHFEVMVAHEGFDALNRVPEIEPDLFVIDGMMPKMSGYQLIDMLKGAHDTHYKPIIFCSTRDNDRDRKLVQQKGVQYYLVKPIEPATLLKTVRDLIASPDFHVGDKKHSIKELLYEDGARRAAQKTVESRKRRWETYDTLEKFLKATVKEPGKDKK